MKIKFTIKTFLLFVVLSPLFADAQQLPAVNFNHFFLVIDSADLAAIQHSDFIKNEFAATRTSTTKADSAETWTGTYISGVDNYFEIFDSSGIGAPAGYSGVGFSVDTIGDLKKMNAQLSKKYKIETDLREKQYDDKKLAWFTWLAIIDSAFDSASHISFWMMEYRPEYYNYNHWKYSNNILDRATHLSQYAEERKNKILKRFTGLTFNATAEEIKVFSGFLLDCGYKKIDSNSYASPENFIIRFVPRNKDDRLSIASAAFESNISRNDTVDISNNVQIQFHNNTGEIVFK